MDIDRYGLGVCGVDECFLVISAEKSHLKLIRASLDDLGRPVRKALLLGEHQLVVGSARLAEPILFPVFIGVSVAVPAQL